MPLHFRSISAPPPSSPEPNDCKYLEFSLCNIYLSPRNGNVNKFLFVTAQNLVPDNVDAESTKSEGTVASTDSDVPLKPTNELDKRVSKSSFHKLCFST